MSERSSNLLARVHIPVPWDHLSGKQKSLINHEQGPMLVYAGPGTGKTEVLTWRVAKLIQKGIDPDEILAITLTRKARNEMIGRLKEFNGLDKINLKISTLHGTAVQILGSYDSLRDYIAASDETSIIFGDAVEDIVGRVSRSDFKEYIEWVETQKCNYSHPEDCKEGINRSIYERYEELLEHNKVQDLGGIILKCVSLLDELGDLYDPKIKHLLVDEYQDINHTEYAFIKHLSKNTDSLFCVGDDDQSIYGWRGADPQILHDFVKDFDDADSDTIEESRRCTEEILDGAIEIVQKCKVYHPKKLSSIIGKGEKIIQLSSRNHEYEAEWVSNKIRELNSDQDINLNDIAILTKQLNRADELYKIMLRKGIRVNYWRPNQIFKDSNVRKIMAVSRIICDRADNLALRVCLQYIRNYGIGKVGIRNLRKIGEKQNTNLWDVLRNGKSIDACGKWGDNYENFAEFIDALDERLSDKNPEECITEISKVFVQNPTLYIERLIEFSRPHEESSLKNFIQEFNNQKGLELKNENVPTTLDQNAVNIMSVHASKGLGFRAIFLVGLEEGFFPNPARDLDEQRRLCYVAMTRAKEQLFMCYSVNIVGPVAFGSRVYPPSSYLTEIPVACKTIIRNF